MIGKIVPPTLEPVAIPASASPSFLSNQCGIVPTAALNTIPLHIYGYREHCECIERRSSETETHPDPEALTQQELPKLRALGGQECAGDEQPGREGHRKSEVTDVKQPAENETGHEHERILIRCEWERNYHRAGR